MSTIMFKLGAFERFVLSHPDEDSIYPRRLPTLDYLENVYLPDVEKGATPKVKVEAKRLIEFYKAHRERGKKMEEDTESHSRRLMMVLYMTKSERTKEVKNMSTQRAALFIGSGKAEQRGKNLRKLLENAGFDVIIVPISDEGFLELSRGGYMYTGKEIDLIEKQLKESNTFPTPEAFIEIWKKGDQTYDILGTKIDDNQKHD